MPSGRLRAAGSAVLLLSTLAVASCTTQNGAPSPLTPAPHRVAAASPSTGTAAPGAEAPRDGAATGITVPPTSGTANQDDSRMTPVPEASGCTTSTALGNRAPVRAEQLWPGASEIGADAVEVRARSGDSGCVGALPDPPECDLSLPWAALDPEDLARATGAGRVMSGRVFARLGGTSGSGSGTASLLYLALDFARSDHGISRAMDWFSRAVTRCGLGGAGSIGGVSGLVGERHKPTLGPGDAGRFLVTTQGAQLVCLVFDGAAWSPTGRADVVRRVLLLLRSS
jgi:hypothetical protein